MNSPFNPNPKIEKLNMNCLHCSKPFIAYPSAERKFCSNRCADSYRSFHGIDHNNIPENFYEKSFSFGYVLGVIIGDGCIYKTTFSLVAKDMDFVLEFQYHVEEWIGFKPRIKLLKRIAIGKDQYRVRVNSIFCSEYLREQISKIFEIGITSYPFEFKKGLLKGLFDSEGSISLRYRRRNNWSWEEVNLRFSNSDILIHQLFRTLMKQICNLEPCKKLHKGKGALNQSYYGIKKVMKYKNIVGITIKRKEAKLCDIKQSL